MKKLFYLLIAVALIGCKTDEPEVKKFQLDPNAMISIKPFTASNSPQKAKSNYTHLSSIEIVKQAVGISFQNFELYGNQSVNNGFADSQRDTIANPPCLKMWGTFIISQFGEYVPEFVEATDIILFRAYNNKRDTIAYIPNSILNTAEVQIKAALVAKDTSAVYNIFDNTFKFIPITGVEWLELKKQNLQ